jgi:hypothetical protein
MQRPEHTLRLIRGHRRARGAILAEALLVIMSLSLILLGLIYVHLVFTRQLRVQKAARAAAFAYSLGGCEGTTPPGLSQEDMQLLGSPGTAAGSSDSIATAHQHQNSVPAAGNAFSRASSDNTGFGLPDTASIGARARASASDGQTTLTGEVHARTTLLCNEAAREGTLNNSVSYIVDFLK